MLKSVNILGCLFVLGALAGCSSNNDATLHTQAQGEVSLKADQYSIQVVFSVDGDSIEQASSRLKTQLTSFIQWQEQSGFNVVTTNESVQPMYHYPKDGVRQVKGFNAQHRFDVKGLNLQQYADTMTLLATFKPHSLNQGSVEVSEDMRQHAEQQAYGLAFMANKSKLDTLMGLGNLCDAQVSSIQEHSQSQGMPRVMMMEAKSAPVANEHMVSVSLEMTWRATPCL